MPSLALLLAVSTSFAAPGPGATPDAPGPATPPPRPFPSPLTLVGQLDMHDETLDSGEYTDAYPLPCAAGAHVSVVVSSTAFSTYVILKLPGQENVDAEATNGAGATAEATVTQGGTCTVMVTSSKAGETGVHTTVAKGFGPSPSAAPTSAPVPTAAQFDAALRAWDSDFRGHLGEKVPQSISLESIYATDLTFDGASSATVHIKTFDESHSTLVLTFDAFDDEKVAAAASLGLAARIDAVSMSCCTLGLRAPDSTTWLVQTRPGQSGPKGNVWMAAKPVQVAELDPATNRSRAVWKAALTVYQN